MTIAANLGWPRIGPKRELKTALEAHWAGTSPESALLEAAAAIRAGSRALQQSAGIGHVPSADFALYDHVLETGAAFGAVPPGYGWDGDGPVGSATLFAMARGARGTEAERAAGIDPAMPALALTKWFDTNYHHLVPEIGPGTRLRLVGNRWADAVREGLAQGCRTRPVLLGPVTLLLLARTADGASPLSFLPALLPAYAAALRGMAEAGAAWVQIDEPMLVTDLPAGAADAYRIAFRALAEAAPGLRLLLATYFGGLDDNLGLAASLPVDGLHLDLVRAPGQLGPALAALPPERWLSLGVVDGRNVWRSDLRAALATLAVAASRPGGAKRLMVAPSCSLLHVPQDLRLETSLDPALARRLAFARLKLGEVATLARALDEGVGAVAAAFAESDAVAAERRADPAAHDPAVAARLAAVTPAMAHRASPFPVRAAAQQARLGLPAFPVTTIGSLPQTAAVRQARARLARGETDRAAYEGEMATLIAEAIAWQDAVGVDVPVHGEFERDDMVKHFAALLDGYATTKHGWVQSYGSRCVAPPILWRDVARPAPLTVRWARFAQAQTTRPVKGMLTGPVTMLHWAFVRDDLPAETVCRQLALAIRDEVADLEAAGIAIVQIDEPAFREGLPLRVADRADYLRWAVDCFRLASAGAADTTQIHTHMCYSEFGDILPAIAAMDADVLSIETARSRMALLEAFAAYPNAIGPGVWDIHAPRVPAAEDMAALLRRAVAVLPRERLWANPDCGCKTRGWAEVRPAVANLVAAARQLRAEA